jgi:hypothetical protein
MMVFKFFVPKTVIHLLVFFGKCNTIIQLLVNRDICTDSVTIFYTCIQSNYDM